MSRPGLGGPMSPLSMNSQDSFASRYGGSLGGTTNDIIYSGGPYGARPPNQPSPPGSNHPSTDSSQPSTNSSMMNRPPSSVSSMDGRSGFGGPPGVRDSGRSHMRPDNEEALRKHYHVLKGYLASSLRDEKGNIKPNKARDKLLRLSVTQFMELSTDVYDELIRREDQRTGRVQSVPPSLLPKRDFHPKRNQARQKLSTLPTERFRQLATDVFYELERRIPRLAGGLDRPVSAASNRSTRPPPGYRGPPPGPGGRPPMGPGPNGMGPPNAPYSSFRPASPGLPLGSRPPTTGSEASNYDRPQPNTFQSKTIVPNKSTMVEDDDDDDEEDDEDAFGLEKALNGIGGGHFREGSVSGSSKEDQEKIKAQEAEIAELRLKIESLETSMFDKEHEVETINATLQEKDTELESFRSSGQTREAAEQSEWYNLRVELEQKHLDAQRLNEDLQRELDLLDQRKGQDEEELRAQHELGLEDLRIQLGNSHRMTIGDLRTQLDSIHDQTGDLHRQLQTHEAENDELRRQLQSAQDLQLTVNNGDYERRIDLLQEELAQQEKLTNQVRDEAMMYLQEMRDLSRQNDHAIEQEEKLASRVAQLERETDDWRWRHAKVKAQNNTLRASTLGLGLQTSFDSGSLVRQEGLVSESGLVRDTDVTRFQTAIDELLKVARQTATQPMLESVKNVVICVQSITSAVGTDGYPTPSESPLSPDGPHQRTRSSPQDSVGRLKARVTGTANSLITATKQHATASGLSPVALLDAAASNLTASVVELIKSVGIKPTPRNELHSDVELDVTSEYGDQIPVPHTDDTRAHSFYDDHEDLSVGLASFAKQNGGHSAQPSVQVSAPVEEVKPAPLGLGRSGTTKKGNGWFGGWGKKASVDETMPAVTGNGVEEEEEYDPYR